MELKKTADTERASTVRKKRTGRWAKGSLLPGRTDVYFPLTSLHAHTTRPTTALFQSPLKSSMRL